jgi:hypothetical protein
MKTRLLIISSLIIIGVIIVTLSLVISGIYNDKTIDSSGLEYLKSLQKLCKQNEGGGSVSMIDGPRWQNTTHYFDVPDCKFRKL